MYKNKSVSVVMSTYNEKDSIREIVDGFFETGYVDEVIVVDNNAAEGTVEEVQKTKATLIHEPKQGYGHGFQAGLAAATGDILVMCEPDATFFPDDLPKYLVYSDQLDVVLGSRTNATMILEGANMGLFLKYGNYFVAKLAQYLFPLTAPHLSDCGCTYRLMTRKAYETLQPHFQEGASAFGFELSMLTLRCGLNVCEIPIRYGERVGESAVTGDFWKTFQLGCKMINMCFVHWWKEKIQPIKGK